MLKRIFAILLMVVLSIPFGIVWLVLLIIYGEDTAYDKLSKYADYVENLLK